MTPECYSKNLPEKDSGFYHYPFLFCSGGISDFQTVTLCIKQPLTVLYRVISCLFPPALSTGLRKYFLPVPIHRSVPAAREVPADVRHSLYLFTWKGVTFFHD